jgi:hypothetical protein
MVPKWVLFVHSLFIQYIDSVFLRYKYTTFTAATACVIVGTRHCGVTPHTPTWNRGNPRAYVRLTPLLPMDTCLDRCDRDIAALTAEVVGTLSPAIHRLTARVAVAQGVVRCADTMATLIAECRLLRGRMARLGAKVAALAVSLELSVTPFLKAEAGVTRGGGSAGTTAGCVSTEVPRDAAAVVGSRAKSPGAAAVADVGGDSSGQGQMNEPSTVRVLHTWNRRVSVYPVRSTAAASALITKSADGVVTLPELADDASPLDETGGWVLYGKSRHAVTDSIHSLIRNAELRLVYELPDYMRDLPAVKAQVSGTTQAPALPAFRGDRYAVQGDGERACE